MTKPEFINARTAIVLLAATCGLAFSPANAAAQKPPELEITGLRLGFNGTYKLGCWTQVAVTLRGGVDAYTGFIQITTRDPDGVPTDVVTPVDRPVGVIPGESTAARLFIRQGQDGGAIRVRFIDDRGKERAERTFYPGPQSEQDVIPYGEPATTRLVASFGSPRGLGDLTRSQSSDDEATATRGVVIPRAVDLPLEWYGYEAIDALVLHSAQPELYRPLAANPARIDALRRWVELGGRVVIFCGANAPELIGPEGPLASLVPGKYDTLTALRESKEIEAFADAETTISGPEKFQLQAPRLTEVRGRILAFAGPNPTDLPLVVRARQGLGEVTFVAVEPDAAPLADWRGRPSLLRAALQWPDEAPTASDSSSYTGYQLDLIDHLRRKLDESFIGVQPASFGLVALLVILYILLIGPGDYFFVKRVLKRMELTWLTFPLIVVVVSAAAYGAAHYMKGDQLRVNQVEIVDVDVATGLARGTVWTHFFSPRVERYDLALAPHFGDKPIGEPVITGDGEPGRPESEPGRPDPGGQLVGWLGSSGYGLDGMQGRRAQTGLFDRGYAFSPQLDALLRLPVQEWSTKTLIGRWSGELIEPIQAELTRLDDARLAGEITNRTGLTLEDCVLVHDNAGYALPKLADGATVRIDDLLLQSLKSALLVASGDVSDNEPATNIAPLQASVPQLAMAMMFHDALGGADYAQAPNRYQAFIDMSRLLKGDQAILLGRAAAAIGSQWTDGESSLASAQDRRWVYYRFVIPLEEE